MSATIQDELDRLPDDDRWRLQRADGFLDLRMPGRARAELDGVSAGQRDGAPFRVLALRLAMDERAWSDAVCIAAMLRDAHPDEPSFWIQLAYATRRAEGIEAAHRILSEAVARFPSVAVIPFNLACYACRLGRHDEALQRLDQACALDRQFHAMALEDEDLEPIWDRIGG